mmetsp:Transcript_31185/g.79502  ORF Transcript_31185/g.79502 Transcript_31185/m.79502 type:complete len:265 (+) Transcript_31185:341-1135(+)
MYQSTQPVFRTKKSILQDQRCAAAWHLPATAAPHAGDLPTTQKTHAALPLLADTTLAAGAAVALVASTAHLPLLAACQAEARLAGGAQAAHVAVAARRIGRAALLAQALPAGHLEVGRAGARGSSVRLGAALLVKATAGAAIHRGQGCGGGSTKAVGAARVARQALGILAAHLAQRAALHTAGGGCSGGITHQGGGAALALLAAGLAQLAARHARLAGVGAGQGEGRLARLALGFLTAGGTLNATVHAGASRAHEGVKLACLAA